MSGRGAGIGRQARFRTVCPFGRASSTLARGTRLISARGGIGIRNSLRSYARKSVGVRVSPSAQNEISEVMGRRELVRRRVKRGDELANNLPERTDKEL